MLDTFSLKSGKRSLVEVISQVHFMTRVILNIFGVCELSWFCVKKSIHCTGRCSLNLTAIFLFHVVFLELVKPLLFHCNEYLNVYVSILTETPRS